MIGDASDEAELGCLPLLLQLNNRRIAEVAPDFSCGGSSSMPDCEITTTFESFPLSEPSDSICRTTSIPSRTSPM